MPNRKKLAWICAVAVAVTALALVFAAGAAHGTDEPAQRGAACTNVGEHRKNRSGTEYVCEQRPGDDCPVWHAAHPKKGPWPKPSPCICPSKSPSPSVSSSPSKSASASSSPSQSTTSAGIPAAGAPAPGTTPVGNTLPVTGLPTVVIGAATVGVLLVLAGVALLVVSLRRDLESPKETS